MIVNRQRRVRIPVKALDKFAEQARGALRLPKESFTVCLVTDREIARWNRAYRGKKGPTDVLSFRDEPEPKRGGRKKLPRTTKRSAARGYLGDIAIAPSVARRNARRFGRTFEDEMRVLVLHGILHLMGYDHEADTGQMDRRERRLRRALGLA